MSVKYYPAAFINVIRESGTKQEACDYLQSTWNELCEARATISKLEKELKTNEIE